jgi:hypothetical protein
MKVHISDLTEVKPTIIESTEKDSLPDLLEKFYDLYRVTPSWKNELLLLIFDEKEDKKFFNDFSFRGKNENIYGYRLRMAQQVAEKINEIKNYIFGFSAVFVSEAKGNDKQPAGRFVAMSFYEPGFKVGCNKASCFFHVLGKIVPPTPFTQA